MKYRTHWRAIVNGPLCTFRLTVQKAASEDGFRRQPGSGRYQGGRAARHDLAIRDHHMCRNGRITKMSSGVLGLLKQARVAAAVLLVALVLVAFPATAQERALKGVALVIGQSRYENLPELANPANDARAIDRLLSDLGFDVDTVVDGDRRRLERALARFAEDATEADVALVYYAGHGVEAGGQNFLVPIDARMPTAGGAAGDLVAVGAMLDELKRTTPLVIALLDACRDNPYPAGTLIEGEDGKAMPIAAAGLGAPRGAAPLGTGDDSVGPVIGTVIGFAAEPGEAALDGAPGTNSPYSAALLKHLSAGGYAFGDVMTLVAEEVYLETGGRQLPWTNAGLRRLLYFGLDGEQAGADEQAIRGGRRSLLLTIAATPPERRSVVEQVAAEQGVPLDALYGMLDVLGVDAAGGDIGQQLAEGAGRLKAILAARDAQARTDPEIVRLAGLADRAEDEGAIALALDFRAKASARADAIDTALDEAQTNLDARRRELASTYRSHAETAILNFDFRTAAARYGDAFEQVKAIDTSLAYRLKVLQGEALHDLGAYRGENGAFDDSIAAYEQAFGIGRASPDLRRDAALLGNIAIVKTQLAQRSGDARTSARLLGEAGRTYEQVIAMLRKGGAPEDLANAYLNLGGLLEVRADTPSGSQRDLQTALQAYEAAASVLTRRDYPEQWAGLQMNIGGVHARLADRGGGVEDLQRSVAAIEAALEVWTRETYPLNWALAQGNLATTLRALGTAQRSPDLLRRAIAAHESALEVTRRDRQPVSWAGDMNNLGSAYLELAELEGDEKLFARAVETYRAARSVLTTDVDATLHAATLYNEGRALLMLGRRTGSIAHLNEALDALVEGLNVIAATGNPIGYARGRSVEGEVLAEIGRRTGDRKALSAAREAFDEARTLYRQAGMGEVGQGFWEKQITALDKELGR